MEIGVIFRTEAVTEIPKDGPTANAQSVTGDEDNTQTITLSGSDPNIETLIYTLTSQPKNGTANLIGTTVTYEPNHNYNGEDSFTFTVDNGTAISPEATVEITVLPVNDPPVAYADFVEVEKIFEVDGEYFDGEYLIGLTADDPDGDELMYQIEGDEWLHPSDFESAPHVRHYETENSPITKIRVRARAGFPNAPFHDATDWFYTKWVYYDPSFYVGEDSFEFVVFDGSLESEPATVSILVTEIPYDGLRANSQLVTGLEDETQIITLSGSAPNGGTLTYLLEGDEPEFGVASLNGATVTYEPNPNYNGEDLFTFTVNDGTDTSREATVQIIVLPVNDAPIAYEEYVDASFIGQGRRGDLDGALVGKEDDLQNEYDIELKAEDPDWGYSDDGSQQFTFTIVSEPQNGTVEVIGEWAYYVPSVGYEGGDRFEFIVSDGSLESEPTAVYIENITTAISGGGKTWPVEGFSIVAETNWWVYSANLPEELVLGAEISFSGTGTPFDGLICNVVELTGGDAFQIESEVSWDTYPHEPSGLNGVWNFVSLEETDDSVEGTTPPCEYTFDLPAGWSMVSLPCTINDSSLDGIFPTAISLFEFAGGYQNATSMEFGKGYWLNLSTATTASITGTPETSPILDFPSGWSMFGPGYKEVTASSLGDKVISVFGFDAGYFSAPTLEPGQGYWANLSAAGKLDFSGSGSAKSVVGLPQGEEPENAMLWAESEGRQRVLQLGVEANDVAALPPVPPAGLFDVRVEVDGVGAWQVPRTSEQRDYQLQVQGGAMQLGWQMPQKERVLWQLVVNGKVINLEGEGVLELVSGVDEVFVRQAVLPQFYVLEQNFPNPFNPATTIQYSLPAAGPVSLKIYGIDGQVVRHLVSQHQNAGNHQAVWDGLDESGMQTANGVYIYELRAGEYRALRKMLLIK